MPMPIRMPRIRGRRFLDRTSREGSFGFAGATAQAAARRRAFGQLLSVVIVVAAVSVHVHFASTRSVRKASAPRSRSYQQAAAMAPAAAPTPEPTEVVPAASRPAPAPELDRAAVARGEGELDAASRDRARADERSAESARRLTMASTRPPWMPHGHASWPTSSAIPQHGSRRPPSRGGFLRGERDKLEKKCPRCASFHAPNRPRS